MSEILHPKIYNTDRNVLSVVIHKPEGSKKFPAVILLHGFSGYKEEAHIETLAKALADAGVVAVRFDCSGWGESEGDLEYDYTVTNYINDTDCIFNSIKHYDYIDPEKICVWGHSMGGLVAIEYAKSNPAVARVVAVSAPVQIGKSPLLRDNMTSWEKTGYLEIESSKYGKKSIPFGFMKDARSYNALDSVKEITQPILVVVGNADKVVSPADTLSLFTAAPEPKKLVQYDEMGHDYKKYPELLEKVNEAVVTFVTSK